jgi:hypothetical protein
MFKEEDRVVDAAKEAMSSQAPKAKFRLLPRGLQEPGNLGDSGDSDQDTREPRESL